MKDCEMTFLQFWHSKGLGVEWRGGDVLAAGNGVQAGREATSNKGNGVGTG
jgi:hypothetical protein